MDCLTGVNFEDLCFLDDQEEGRRRRVGGRFDSLLDSRLVRWPLADLGSMQSHHRNISPLDVVLELPKLGTGATSAAYRCRLKHDLRRMWVVKIPLEVDSKIKSLPTVDSEISSAHLPAEYEANESDRRAFLHEIQCVRCLLEPRRYDEWTTMGTGLGLIQAEMQRMRAHSGFQSIHPIVHVELNGACGYPMIFSEPCDMTLGNFMQLINFFPNMESKDWKDAARQILAGMAYMCARGVAHEDLHDDNVLVQGHSSAARFLITDFEFSVLNPSYARVRANVMRAVRMVRDLTRDPPSLQWAERFELIERGGTDYCFFFTAFNEMLHLLGVPESVHVPKSGYVNPLSKYLVTMP
jgi:serine/threonine protein kinase